jgi:hypothetical protein
MSSEDSIEHKKAESEPGTKEMSESFDPSISQGRDCKLVCVKGQNTI